MKNQRKTFYSGLLALFLGSSCCWMSTIAIWVGSAGLIGLSMNYAEKIQIVLLAVGLILIIFTLYKNLITKN